MRTWLEIGIPVAGIAIVVALCTVVTSRDIRRWSERSSLVLQPDEKRPVRRAIRTTRTAGLVGALAGFVLAPVLVGVMVGSLASWTIAAGTMVAGLLVGELRSHRPIGAVTAAQLSIRSVDQYLPARVSDACRGIAVAAMVLIGVAALIPSITLGTGSRPTAVQVAMILLVAPLTVALVERAQRWIVSRPQPATDARAVQIDDALRARSVHVLAGAELFLVTLLLSMSVWMVGFRRDLQVVYIVAGIIALVGMVASVRVSNQRWSGRRAVAA